MNEIQKFRNEIDKVLEDIEIATFMLTAGSPVGIDDTVADLVNLYEDSADNLKKAFEELRKNLGDKRIADLKDYGK